jgi:hypothetical protein
MWAAAQDVWEGEHEAALNHVDAAAGARTLVTTRVKGLLGSDCSQIEIGLPSAEDALRLLLQSAGLARGARPPAEAPQVVEMCGRLPLALDIAGRMIAEMGLGGGSWDGVTAILRQELAQSAESTASLEYRIIGMGLDQVPTHDREGCRQVFAVLGCVAEVSLSIIPRHCPAAADGRGVRVIYTMKL